MRDAQKIAMPHTHGAKRVDLFTCAACRQLKVRRAFPGAPKSPDFCNDCIASGRAAEAKLEIKTRRRRQL